MKKVFRYTPTRNLRVTYSLVWLPNIVYSIGFGWRSHYHNIHVVWLYTGPIRVSATKLREDDECSQFSNSMMSVVSSTSSLASEVLKRAAQRQQFWKKVKA